MGTTEEEDWRRLDRALDRALGPLRDAEAPLVVLFSGGVDSGLLAWELRHAPRVSLFTVGVAGSDDLERARDAAPEVGSAWVARTLSEEDLAELDRAVTPELESVAGPRRGIFVALAAGFASAPTGLLVCGQGADELFLGYAHYRGLSEEEAWARSSSDLRTLREDDWPRTVRIARRWDREIVAPYLEPAFVEAASAVPLRERLPGPLTKPYFRRWARHRGLPEALAGRPKRAVQYGTGVDRWLRRGRRSPR